MRVLFLSQIVPYPPHGGVLQRGYNLIRELGWRNEVHLLAFVHPEVLGSAEAIARSREALGAHCASVEYFDLWPKASRLARLAGFLWGGVSALPFSVLAHRSSALRARVVELGATPAFDLVHCDTLALAQYTEACPALPSVLTHHNIESQLMERRAARETHAAGRWYLREQARKLRAYEIAVCPKFDINVTVSAPDAALLHTVLPGLRTAIVPNGVDLAYFNASAGVGPDSPPTLIYTGGMNMFANRDAVLHFVNDIWPAVKAEVPSARFCAVGQDPPLELRRLAGRDPSIDITGYVDDVRPLVAQAAVYVAPLRVGGGTRLKIVDAMAMRRAIVATTVGAEGIEAVPGRHIVIADGATEFAARTIELLRDPGLRDRLGIEARSLVEAKYGWGAIADRLQEAYEVASRLKRQP